MKYVDLDDDDVELEDGELVEKELKPELDVELEDDFQPTGHPHGKAIAIVVVLAVLAGAALFSQIKKRAKDREKAEPDYIAECEGGDKQSCIRSCRANDEDSCINLSKIQAAEGDGGSIATLEKACSNKGFKACEMLVINAITIEEYDLARKYLDIACRQGHEPACEALPGFSP